MFGNFFYTHCPQRFKSYKTLYCEWLIRMYRQNNNIIFEKSKRNLAVRNPVLITKNQSIYPFFGASSRTYFVSEGIVVTSENPERGWGGWRHGFGHNVVYDDANSTHQYFRIYNDIEKTLYTLLKYENIEISILNIIDENRLDESEEELDEEDDEEDDEEYYYDEEEIQHTVRYEYNPTPVITTKGIVTSISVEDQITDLETRLDYLRKIADTTVKEEPLQEKPSRYLDLT